MICKKCNSAFADNAKFCPNCGATIEEELNIQDEPVRKCPKCGALNPSSAKFCKIDGYNFQQSEEQAATTDVEAERISDKIFCPKCGAAYEAGVKFCKKDGTSLEKGVSARDEDTSETITETKQVSDVFQQPEASTTAKTDAVKPHTPPGNDKQGNTFQYFYLDDQRINIGPVTLDELQELQKKGMIKSNTFVIQKGEKEWIAFSKLLASADSSSAVSTGSTAVQKDFQHESSNAPPAENRSEEKKAPDTSMEQSDTETGREELDRLLEEIISTQIFEPEYLEQLKEKGNQAGYSEEQLMILVEKKLLQEGFIPDPDADIKESATIKERLSVGWKTYERHLEVSISKFRNVLDDQIKGVYNPNDYAKLALSATGFLARDELKLKETLINYLNGKNFKPVGKFEAGSDLKVEWKTDSAIKPVPASLPNSNLKWILIGAGILVMILAISIPLYLYFQKKDEKPAVQVVQPQVSTSVKATDGTHESTRILSLDALRLGTDLSVTISKIPKLEKVVEAAKELGEISPRYQEQITTAENTLNSAQQNCDKNLLAYLGKVVELGSYTPEQISYAMGVINSTDRTLREKKVIELIARHVDYIQKNKGTDPVTLMADFREQFNDFVD